MNLFKKMMTGVAVGALTLAVAGGVGSVSADAASATFNPASQTMTVSGDGAEVMVSFDAIKASKTDVTWNEKAKWDIYDGDSATVDLSSLAVAKDMYIAVKDNTSAAPNVYKIPADTTKLAGKYEVASKASKLTFTDNKAALDAKVKLEYRTENASTWTEYKEASFTMAMYEQQGATLYFRKKAAAMTATAAETEEDDAPAYIMNTVTGNFASKEIKVKVAKMANAPSATIDYDAGTFKLKAGTEYRQINASGDFVAVGDAEAGTFTAAGDKPVSVDVTKDGVFEVRTAASDKKVASKIAVYAYKGVAKPGAVNVVEGEAKPAAGKLNIQYGKDKKDNDQVTFINGNTSATYVIYAEDPATAEKPKAIATVKPAESKGYKDVTLAASKVANNTKLYFVTASDKKTGVFRSSANSVTITYPKEAEPDTEE